MNLQEYKRCLNEIEDYKLSQLKKWVDGYGKLIFLGNGGSNAIASHMAVDYTKVLGKRALSFSDSAMLSCYANDYGWENAYQKYLEHFADRDTLVVLISSSGNSKNILNAAEYCVQIDAPLITLSGFSETNPLKERYSKFSLPFWVNSADYGVVECTHQAILHSIV